MREIFYSIKQAFKQISRNGAMTLASIFSITAILLILGLFFILVVNVNNIAENAKQDFDSVQIYLEESVKEEESAEMIESFKSMPEVKEATFLSKQDALENWKDKWGDKAYLLERYEDVKNNPLPNSIIVSVTELEDAYKVVKEAKAMDGVEDVNYFKETVDRLLKITNYIQIGSLAIIIFLVIISVVVVSNTIKLTVMARGHEIAIMKYVGATNWFIRKPFLFEGIFIGIFAALVSVGIIGFIYNRIADSVGPDMIAMLSTNLVSESFLMSNLVLIFLALGISIGACGSIISMRRFLDT